MSAIVIVIFLSVCSYLLYSHHVQTTAYQIDKAQEYAANGDYDQAIACLEAAYNEDESQSQLLFLEADYYYLMQDNEAALRALRQVIDKGIYPYEDVEEAYDKMITIYAKESAMRKSMNCFCHAGKTRLLICFRVIWQKNPILVM